MLKRYGKSLCIVFVIIYTKNFAFGQKILPPSIPKKRAPIYDEETHLNSIKQKKKEKREEENPSTSILQKELPSEKLTPDFNSNEKKQDPVLIQYHYFFSLSLSLSSIKTTSTKRTYQSDPNSHIIFMKQMLDDSKKLNDQSFWLGARIASLSGTANVKDIYGRYNFTYIGPSFGIGNIYYPEEKLFSRIEKDKAITKLSGERKPTHAYFLLSGIAGTIRKIDLDPSIKEPPEDLQTTKSVSFVKPQLWIEGVYINFNEEQHIAMHYSIGLQKGAEKTWFWISLAVGGWL